MAVEVFASGILHSNKLLKLFSLKHPGCGHSTSMLTKLQLQAKSYIRPLAICSILSGQQVLFTKAGKKTHIQIFFVKINPIRAKGTLTISVNIPILFQLLLFSSFFFISLR